jgi:hypothetical protein
VPARLDRRRWLLSGVVAGTAILTGACKKRSETCPPAELAPEDTKVREALHYTDHSPDPQKLCEGCQQYVPNTDADCGGCKLMKGPIHPAGYCNAFVAIS